MSIQERLRSLYAMTEADVTQVGRWAGLSYSHMSKLIRGERGLRPGPETIERVAAVFGVSPGWLAFGEGPAPDPEAVRASVEAARARHEAARAAEVAA